MGRKDEMRTNRSGGYIETTNPSGYNVLINGTDKYLNFNSTSGLLGYGFRDNAGVMEFKNSAGAWVPISTGGGGDMTKAVYDPANGAKQVAFEADVQTQLSGKVTSNVAITGATKTKITYDAKGLVTSGADATTADIADSTNKRYVTDAQLTVIGNTSGTNTGDNATNSQYSGLATSKLSLDQTTPQTIINGQPIQDTLTASQIVATDASKKLQSLAVATYPSLTELSYVKGVTSAIQTQLDGKVTGFADPNADRIVFRDDSAGAYAGLVASTGLTISGTNMTVRSSSATQTGIVELATDAETVTGTDTARATTPANITARLQSPTTIGSTAPNTGKFTTVETTSNIELGHASDTTISRVGAGQIAVEGNNVMTVASADTVAGVKTFNKDTLKTKGTSTGVTTISTANTSATNYTATLPAKDGTIAMTSDITGTNSGTNTGDQTSIVGITGTKAQFDTAVTDGNFLYVGDVTSNATHTGDVTGATALTIDKTAITGKTEVTAVPGTDYVLISDTSDSGNLKKALLPAGGGSGDYNDLTNKPIINVNNPDLDTLLTPGVYKITGTATSSDTDFITVLGFFVLQGNNLVILDLGGGNYIQYISGIDVIAGLGASAIYRQYSSSTRGTYTGIKSLTDDGAGNFTLLDGQTLSLTGTSTGKTQIATANTSATDYVATLPAKSGTIAMTSDITGGTYNPVLAQVFM